MQTLFIETCCSTYEDAIQSREAGIRRIELNTALALGGLTASLPLLKKIKNDTDLRVMAMLRPREGGMADSTSEFEIMEYDLDSLLEAGADGIVFGVLQENSEIDQKRTEKLRNKIGSKEAVFHRAFDLTPNPEQALEQLIQLEFDRVLTSGQQPTVPQGQKLLVHLKEQAQQRIEILPGGGLRMDNVLDFIGQTGFLQIHFTPRKPKTDQSASFRPSIHFGHSKESGIQIAGEVDADALKDIIQRFEHVVFQDVSEKDKLPKKEYVREIKN